MDISKNTVDGKNQIKTSAKTSFLGNPDAKTKILIVGNSITRHSPKEDIGWYGDWGMAASCEEKDYVHRLVDMIDKAGKSAYVMVRQVWEWEQGYTKVDCLDKFKEEHDFNADVVVFRLGDNVNNKDEYPYFREALKKFVEYICPNGKVIFTTCFWHKEFVDDEIKRLACERDEVCIDGSFSRDESNMALGQFKHEGVSVHPSDKGMEVIATAIFDELIKEL